jgi:hypothetical protein
MTYFQAQNDCGSSPPEGDISHRCTFSHYVKTWGSMPQAGVFCNLLVPKLKTDSSLQNSEIWMGATYEDIYICIIWCSDQHTTHYTLCTHTHTHTHTQTNKTFGADELKQYNIQNQRLATLWCSVLTSTVVSVKNAMKIYLQTTTWILNHRQLVINHLNQTAFHVFTSV